MQNLMKDKEKKESARKGDLKRRGAGGMNQEETAKEMEKKRICRVN